jgi:integrase
MVSASTQHRIFATLRTALNAAVRQRKLTCNPCVGVELEPGERTEAKRWTAGEAARFIAAVADDPMGLMFRIAVLAGVRRGELVGPRWSGADLGCGVLTIERPILQLGGKLSESRPKTEAGERKVFLDAETAELLRQWRRAWLAMRLRAGEGGMTMT